MCRRRKSAAHLLASAEAKVRQLQELGLGALIEEVRRLQVAVRDALDVQVALAFDR